MKRIQLIGIQLVMLFAIFSLSVKADDVPLPEEYQAELTDSEDDEDVVDDSDEAVLDSTQLAQLEAEADAALTAVPGTAVAVDEYQADYDYRTLTPQEYAKVKTKRKVTDLILRFLINTIFCFLITRCFYFPKSRRRDFFFTYMLVGFAIFMLIHLMSGETMETGIGMGLFAIFCIMRYRTESVPIREMTYLFVIIALAALNGMAWDISMKKEQFVHRETIAMGELVLTNLLFIIIVWITEGKALAKGLSSKYINYDKIDLIVPEKRDELIEDLKKRTGLDITSVNIGNIDFLKDMAFIKIFYRENEEHHEMPQKMPKIMG